MRLNPDGVGVRVGDVSDPALRWARLNGRQAQEAELQTRHGELWQLEAQTDRTNFQYGGRAEAGDLQLKTGTQEEGRDTSCESNEFMSLHLVLTVNTSRFLQGQTLLDRCIYIQPALFVEVKHK